MYKFCFSCPTRDGRRYTVWIDADSLVMAKEKLALQIGESFALRSTLTASNY